MVKGRKHQKVSCEQWIVKGFKIVIVQWKPVKVTPLKVNNRLRSTVDVGPVLYALYISNLNPDNVNHLRPQSC